MEIKIVDLVKAAGYTDTEYQHCVKLLSSSEKHKARMGRSTFKGDIIEGNMQDLIKDLKELDAEYKKKEAVEKAKEQERLKEEQERLKEEQERLKEKLAKEQESLKAIEKKVGNGKDSPLFDLKGVRGRSIKVYKDRVVIKVEATAGAILTGNLTDGEKTIFYHDCIGIQFKETKGLIGYLQLETASGMMNNSKDNFFNENTFTFDEKTVPNEKAKVIAIYITEQVAKHKQLPESQNTVSAADEIKKYKELLDNGAITADEYESKKVELLYQ